MSISRSRLFMFCILQFTVYTLYFSNSMNVYITAFSQVIIHEPEFRSLAQSSLRPFSRWDSGHTGKLKFKISADGILKCSGYSTFTKYSPSDGAVVPAADRFLAFSTSRLQSTSF